MKTIRFHEYGDPHVLQLDDLPTPDPAAGQVRVRLTAAGVNFIDTYQRRGRYPVPLPYTPGSEGAGVVDALGADVTLFRVGDPVAFAMTPGAYAESVIVPADKLVPVPPSVGLKLAAAVMLQGMTAHYLTDATFPLHAGHTALVHAAAGGTGQLIVQMAKQRGARVIATVSTEAKAEIARGVGADAVILYTQQDFEIETRRLTDGVGVDVVYDSVGATTFEQSLKSLKPRGLLALFGAASGPVPPFDLARLNGLGSLFVTRPSLGHYLLTREELLRRAGAVFAGIADGWLHPAIDREFALADAAAAHTALEGRESLGKFVLLL